MPRTADPCSRISQEPAMKFNFTVGDQEQHQMEFSLDQSSGDLNILLDGNAVVRDIRAVPYEPVKRYDLNVGNGEKHRVSFTVAFGEESQADGSAANTRLIVTAHR
jgi:hypothetical protein